MFIDMYLIPTDLGILRDLSSNKISVLFVELIGLILNTDADCLYRIIMVSHNYQHISM